MKFEIPEIKVVAFVNEVITDNETPDVGDSSLYE